MKKLITILSLTFLMFTANAQDNKTTEGKPYVTVNGFQTDLNAMIFNKDKIKSMDVLKDTAATKLYGRRGKFGMVVIKTTEPINFMRVNALLNRFRVADSLRTLRVAINEVIVADKALILADETEVEEIKPVNKNGEMILNIKTWKR